jgi:hypothetical protein
MSILQFSSTVNAQEMNCDTDTYLYGILDRIGEFPEHPEMQHTLNGYKTALADLTNYQETIKTSGIDYTLPVDEFDDEETMEIKMLMDVLRASVIAARSACYTELSNGFGEFMVGLQQAKYKLTVRILSMMHIFGTENVSWEGVFGAYFEQWIGEHRKLLYRYRTYHTLVAYLKRDSTYVDQTVPHPHLNIHIAIHEQKYQLLRDTKSEDGQQRYRDIPDSYTPIEFAISLKPSAAEKRQANLCKVLPKVLEALNGRNANQLYKVKLFLKAFSHSVMSSYLTRQLTTGQTVTLPETVDFTPYSEAVGISVTDNATMLFNSFDVNNTDRQLVMSGDIFNSAEAVKQLANQAADFARSVYRTLSAEQFELQLGRMIPMSAPLSKKVSSSAASRLGKDPPPAQTVHSQPRVSDEEGSSASDFEQPPKKQRPSSNKKKRGRTHRQVLPSNQEVTATAPLFSADTGAPEAVVTRTKGNMMFLFMSFSNY